MFDQQMRLVPKVKTRNVISCFVRVLTNFQEHFGTLACVSWIRAMNLQFNDSFELCRPCLARMSYAICGEMHSQNVSDICSLNLHWDSELGEINASLGDFVSFNLKSLGLHKDLRLCEFGTEMIECLLVALLTNAGSLKL